MLGAGAGGSARAQDGAALVASQDAPVQTDDLISHVMSLDERAIRLIQSRLFELGYYRGPPAGVADETTFAAILAFHQENPGPVADLEAQIRAAVAGRDESIVEEDGKLHLRRFDLRQQAPLCLDLPGRSDCAEAGE